MCEREANQNVWEVVSSEKWTKKNWLNARERKPAIDWVSSAAEVSVCVVSAKWVYCEKRVDQV